MYENLFTEDFVKVAGFMRRNVWWIFLATILIIGASVRVVWHNWLYDMSELQYENDNLKWRNEGLVNEVNHYFDLYINKTKDLSECKVYVNELESLNEVTLGYVDVLEDYNYNHYEFEKIAKDIADQHDYDVDSYNCLNYAKDLNRELRINGYESWIECGYVDNVYHAWVEVVVPIDWGGVVSQDVYNRYYEKKGWCGE